MKLLKLNPMGKKAELIYLDWRNNFLTVERFAEYYETNKKDADRFLTKIRKSWKLQK